MKTNAVLTLWSALTARLAGANETIPPLILRLIMGWEFWESGTEKLYGENWFADIQSRFPFPFDVIPANLSWGIATWFELIGAVMLWIGLGTRLFAFILLFLTFVATAAVHWPTTRAGMPATVVRAGTSRSTTLPAATFAPSPISMLPRIFAPAPSSTPRRTLGCRSPRSLPVPPSVTSCRIETLSSTTAVSPITTLVP